MMNNIIEYLDELFPYPRCELNYSKDYELLLSVMMSAQTTDKRVNMVNEILFKKYPTINSLANSDINDIIRIIKPIGTYKKKANNIKEICNRLIKDYNGVVPNNRSYLESLPGVGRKTTNVVLANLYNEPCIAVDTHVSRVSKRLGIVSDNDDVLVIENKLTNYFPQNKLGRLHHQLVLFGRYYCKAKNPNCDRCRLKEICQNDEKNFI